MAEVSATISALGAAVLAASVVCSNAAPSRSVNTLAFRLDSPATPSQPSARQENAAILAANSFSPVEWMRSVMRSATERRPHKRPAHRRSKASTRAKAPTQAQSSTVPPTAPRPQTRPDAPLDEGLTAGRPPVPAPRPEPEPSQPLALPPPAATAGSALDEGLTSGRPPLPVKRPEPPRPEPFGPPVPAATAGNELNEGLTSEQPPLPQPRPDPQRAGGDFIGPPAPPAIAKPPPPRPAVPAQKMAECIAGLEKLGAEFSRQPPISDPSGCAVQNPVTLSTLGNRIKLAPPALLDCPMALAAVSFMNDTAAPSAKRDLGSDLVAIGQASGYVCRPRHGTVKLSEHAYGNALDIANFGLADGRRVEVKDGVSEPEAKFLDAMRKAACGPFKTVLGPGSDADHALHFHFDLAPRRNGSTFCQ